MKIMISMDRKCWTKEKIEEDILGGTERFGLLLRNWLLQEGHEVYDSVLNPTKDPVDVIIYSNTINESVPAKKKILWAGSWHAPVHDPFFDEVILNSNFMRNQMGCRRGYVIHAAIGDDLKAHDGTVRSLNTILTTSNPNRCANHIVKIAENLDKLVPDYKWFVTGGNKLYSDDFQEGFYSYQHNRVYYIGPRSRKNLLYHLSLCHVWAYPNFSDQSETQCVAMLEVAYYKKPVILPRRLPFTEILPDAIFVDTPEEMAHEIKKYLEKSDPITYNLDRFSEEVIKKQILEVIER